jgi:hypothetical protein
MIYFVKISFFIIFILASSCTTGKAMELEGLNLPAGDINKQNIASGKILVRFKLGTGTEVIKMIQEKYGLETEKIMGTEGLYLMINKGDMPLDKLINELKKHDEVMYAEPDYKYRIDNK